jgi:hypothetical protein
LTTNFAFAGNCTCSGPSKYFERELNEAENHQPVTNPALNPVITLMEFVDS